MIKFNQCKWYKREIDARIEDDGEWMKRCKLSNIFTETGENDARNSSDFANSQPRKHC